jgi:hypothetical protein
MACDSSSRIPLSLKSSLLLWENWMTSKSQECVLTPELFRDSIKLEHDALASLPLYMELENASGFCASEDEVAKHLLFQERNFAVNPFHVCLNLILSSSQLYCAVSEKPGTESFLQLSFLLSKLPRILKRFFALKGSSDSVIFSTTEYVLTQLSKLPALCMKKEFEK